MKTTSHLNAGCQDSVGITEPREYLPECETLAK